MNPKPVMATSEPSGLNAWTKVLAPWLTGGINGSPPGTRQLCHDGPPAVTSTRPSGLNAVVPTGLAVSSTVFTSPVAASQIRVFCSLVTVASQRLSADHASP